MNRLKLIALIGVLVFLLTGCGKPSIVGQWKAEKNCKFSKIEFFSDGTYSSSEVNYAGNYSIDDNRIRLDGILVSTLTYSFEVKGDTLIFKSDNGNRQKYKRIKN